MMLSDAEIREAIASGEITISPFVEEHVGPDSIDIRLGEELLVCRNIRKVLDPERREEAEDAFERIRLTEPFPLYQHQFVLGQTLERIGLSSTIAGMLEGKSSLGRFGILVHMTAGIVHAGFGITQPSTLVLEISSVNPNPVLLKKGMKIAQLSFIRLGRKAQRGYDFCQGSKYCAQSSPRL